MYLRNRVTEKGGDGERDLPFVSLTLQQPEQSQAETKNVELHPGPPHGWQRPEFLGCLLLPSQAHNREPDWRESSQDSVSAGCWRQQLVA